MKDGSIRIQELTWQDISDYLKKNDVVLVPIGSTEQHGPHLPTGCDTYAAIALAEDVASHTGTLTTPPLWFGDSPHHLGFPGTITLRSETLMEVTKDICRSLAKTGFKHIIIINGHRGANLPALNLAVKSLHEHEFPNIFFAVVDPFKISSQFTKAERETEEMYHAAEIETSHLMYKFPNLVRIGKIMKEIPPFGTKFSKFFMLDPYRSCEKIDIAMNSREEAELTKSGVMGDPTAASADKGKRYHEYMVEQLTQFIEWLKERHE